MSDVRAPGSQPGTSRGRSCPQQVRGAVYEDGDESTETAGGGTIATPIVAGPTKGNNKKAR